MTWRSRTCFRAAGLALALGVCSRAATVHGRVEIVASKDRGVRKHSDYSGWWCGSIRPRGWGFKASAGKAEMVQRDKRFTPHVLAIAVGTTVEFPNYDPIFHNAFSNYDGQVFDVGLYPPGTTRSILFKKEGIVRIFCNIHPSMSAIIVRDEIAVLRGVGEKRGVPDRERAARRLPSASVSRAGRPSRRSRSSRATWKSAGAR